MDDAGSGHVGGRCPGDRWKDRWNPARSLSPTEYQSGSEYTMGHPVSRL